MNLSLLVDRLNHDINLYSNCEISLKKLIRSEIENPTIIEFMKKCILSFKCINFKENCEKFEIITYDKNHKEEIEYFKYSESLIKMIDLMNESMLDVFKFGYNLSDQDGKSYGMYVFLKSEVLSPINCKFYTVGLIFRNEKYNLYEIKDKNDDEEYSSNTWLHTLDDTLPENLKEGVLFLWKFIFSRFIRILFFPLF